jgi:hypothetical protein
MFSQRKPRNPAACPLVSKLLDTPGSRLRPPSLCFVAQPSNPTVFWWTTCKPHRLGAASMPIPLITWPPRSSRLGVGFVE